MTDQLARLLQLCLLALHKHTCRGCGRWNAGVNVNVRVYVRGTYACGTPPGTGKGWGRKGRARIRHPQGVVGGRAGKRHITNRARKIKATDRADTIRQDNCWGGTLSDER